LRQSCRNRHCQRSHQGLPSSRGNHGFASCGPAAR
jgi:hypothetical protein